MLFSKQKSFHFWICNSIFFISNVAKTCVANYYQFPGDYPFIDAYMKMLLENQNVNDAGLHLIASTKEDLKGKLVVIYTKSYKYVPADKSGEVYSWLKELKSLFIPRKFFKYLIL